MNAQYILDLYKESDEIVDIRKLFITAIPHLVRPPLPPYKMFKSNQKKSLSIFLYFCYIVFILMHAR